MPSGSGMSVLSLPQRQVLGLPLMGSPGQFGGARGLQTLANAAGKDAELGGFGGFRYDGMDSLDEAGGTNGMEGVEQRFRVPDR